MTVPSEVHNKLAERFTREILGDLMHIDGAAEEDILVLMETCLYGGMLFLMKFYGTPPRHVAQFAEEVLTNALERLSDSDNKRPVSDG